MKSFRKHSVGILGLGQMGGSLAARLKTEDAVSTVMGFDLDRQLLKAAMKMGIIDRAATDEVSLIEDSQIVIMALPISAIETMLTNCRRVLKAKALVADLGSIRGPIQKSASRNKMINHVGIHPICGTALRGQAAWNPDLFKDASCFIFAGATTDRGVVSLAGQLVKAMGGRIEESDYRKHDATLALTSGLPHIIAFALMRLWRESGRKQPSLKGPSFAGATRVVSSDPEMVAQLIYHNRANLLRTISKFQSRIAEFEAILSQGDLQKLKNSLENYGKVSQGKN